MIFKIRSFPKLLVLLSIVFITNLLNALPGDVPGTTFFFHSPGIVLAGGDAIGLETQAGSDSSGLYLPLIEKAVYSPDEMIDIPAGPFQMGCDPAHNGYNLCNPSETPLRTVTMDAYRIDKYEVTNSKYARCVAQEVCTLPGDIVADPYTILFYNDPAYDQHPVMGVDWYQASAFCTWAGKRLPTEAEWEKAARGPTARFLPWGDAWPTCRLANFSPEIGTEACESFGSAVGSYPAGASPYGLMDMAGNAYEWVNDWYQPGYYSVSPASNPPGPDSGQYRVVRGGAWSDLEAYMSTTLRGFSPPALRLPIWGFRCAASLP